MYTIIFKPISGLNYWPKQLKISEIILFPKPGNDFTDWVLRKEDQRRRNKDKKSLPLTISLTDQEFTTNVSKSCLKNFPFQNYR